MPRVTRSAEEEVLNLHRRASELAINIGRGLVTTSLKRHPQCVGDMVNKLESLGLVEADGNGKKKIVDAIDNAQAPCSV